MYTDSTLKPIGDTDQYTALDGTQYPWNYPKAQIAGLHRVTETERPNDATKIITGFEINENYTQIWQTRDKTEAELSAERKSQALSILIETDLTVLRFIEKQMPKEWRDYRQEQRDLASGRTTIKTLSEPPYPDAT